MYYGLNMMVCALYMTPIMMSAEDIRIAKVGPFTDVD